VFPFFSVAFSLVYFFGVYTGYGPIRYYPILGEWHLAAVARQSGPGPVMSGTAVGDQRLRRGFIVGGLGFSCRASRWNGYGTVGRAPVAVTIVLIVRVACPADRILHDLSASDLRPAAEAYSPPLSHWDLCSRFPLG